MKSQAEFDQYSSNYHDLLRDPIRDRFGGGDVDFFHKRKRDLIAEHFQRRGVDTRSQAYLDFGCGKGELLALLQPQFALVAGCDPSSGMLESSANVAPSFETRMQVDPAKIPFEDASFDFVTAVCVFHHVPVAARDALVKEIRRVLRPGGTIAIIEHNPINPVTRLIVSRLPVDADAILLYPNEVRRLYEANGIRVEDLRYFLYFPERLYSKLTSVEEALDRVPMGGQYAIFGRT